MGQFVLFTEHTVRRSDGPTATIQARGALGINNVTFERLGKPESVLLYFDAQDKRVGIQPAKGNNPNARPVRSNGAGVAKLINARNFMATNNIAHDKTVSVAVSFEGDMAILDVSSVMTTGTGLLLNGQGAGAE